MIHSFCFSFLHFNMTLWFEQINAHQLAQADQLIIFKKDEEGKGNVNPKFTLM